MKREPWQSCSHRGGSTRLYQCKACCKGSGHYSLKVFACQLHGECALSGKVPDVKFCGACQDVATADDAPAPRAVEGMTSE